MKRPVWLPDAAAVAAIVVYSLAIWWPTRALPYHWDAAMFTIPAARDLLATHFHPFVVGHSDFAHPPVFMAMLALAWELFGVSRGVSHAFVFPFLPLAMAGTYVLGSNLSPPKRDRALGLAAAFLFGGVAVVLEEVGQIYAEIPAAAAIAWGLAAFLSGRIWTSSALFALAAAFRIPSMIIPIALGGIVTLRAVLAPPAAGVSRALSVWRAAGVKCLALLVPFACFALWLGYHRAVTGWTISVAGRSSYVSRDPLTLLQNFAIIVKMMLLGEYRCLIPALALAADLYVRLRKPASASPVPPHALTLLGCAVAGCAFFAVWGEFGLRYGIFLLPAYFVGGLAILRTLPYGPLPFALVSAATFALFVTTWHPTLAPTTGYDYMPPQNLGYLDMISIGKDAAHYVAEKYPEAEVYGAVPESYQLTDPDEGYVDVPHTFIPCSLFQQHPDRKQLIYRHGYSPGQIACGKVIAATGARLKKRFEADGHWVEVFQVPKPHPEVDPKWTESAK